MCWRVSACLCQAVLIPRLKNDRVGNAAIKRTQCSHQLTGGRFLAGFLFWYVLWFSVVLFQSIIALLSSYHDVVVQRSALVNVFINRDIDLDVMPTSPREGWKAHGRVMSVHNRGIVYKGPLCTIRDYG